MRHSRKRPDHPLSPSAFQLYRRRLNGGIRERPCEPPWNCRKRRRLNDGRAPPFAAFIYGGYCRQDDGDAGKGSSPDRLWCRSLRWCRGRPPSAATGAAAEPFQRFHGQASIPLELSSPPSTSRLGSWGHRLRNARNRPSGPCRCRARCRLCLARRYGSSGFFCIARPLR